MNCCQYQQDFNKIIDFPNLYLLEKLSCEAKDFLKLKESQLKELTIKFNNSLNTVDINPSFEIEKKVLEKIISMKTLEKITICFKEMNNKEIMSIEGENKSLKEVNANCWNTDNNICDMRAFQKKFPNLETLHITADNFHYNFENSKINIDIIENENCKVRELELTNYFEKDIKIFTSPFKDLVKCNFSVYDNINNIKNIFTIFKENCPINFIFLKSFSFVNMSDIDINIIKNIYDNFKCMPN